MLLSKSNRKPNLQSLKQINIYFSHKTISWEVICSECWFRGSAMSGLASLRTAWPFPSWAHNGCPVSKHHVHIYVKKMREMVVLSASVPFSRESEPSKNPSLLFYSPLIGQVCVTWPPLAARETRKVKCKVFFFSFSRLYDGRPQGKRNLDVFVRTASWQHICNG